MQSQLFFCLCAARDGHSFPFPADCSRVPAERLCTSLPSSRACGSRHLILCTTPTSKASSAFSSCGELQHDNVPVASDTVMMSGLRGSLWWSQGSLYFTKEIMMVLEPNPITAEPDYEEHHRQPGPKPYSSCSVGPAIPLDVV